MLFAAFIVLESRLANPIMPLRILRMRTLTGSSAIRGLLTTGMFSTFFIGALYLEHVLGYSPVRTGLAFLPATIGMAAMSAGITAWLVNRFGKPVMYPAMVWAAAGLLLLASAGEGASYFPTIFFAFLLLGVGAGASFMPLLQIGMSEIPKADAGLGSGVVNVSQQLAAAVGLAVLSTIATTRTQPWWPTATRLVHSLTAGLPAGALHGGRLRPARPGPGADPVADATSHPRSERRTSPRTCRTRRPWSTSSSSGRPCAEVAPGARHGTMHA